MKPFLYIVGAGLIAWVIVSNANRGKTIRVQRESITRKDDSLARFGRITTRLRQDSSNLTAEKATLLLSEQTALTNAYRATEGKNAAENEVERTVASYNALKRKQAADVLTAGVGKIATTVTDSVLNGDVAVLKGKYRYLNDTLVPALTTAVAVQTERAEREKGRADTAEGKVSDLERALNKDFDASIDERHILGFGQKASKKRLKKKVLEHLD